ncbi:MAG: hypothetical protein ACLFUS_09080 [Candidatus Sumerlaeia bacterium]
MSTSADPYFGSKPSAPLDESLLIWGKVKAESDAPLIAANPAKLTVHVTTEKDIPAGHSIQFMRHFVSDCALPQVEDSSEPNYFECRAEGAEFEAYSCPKAKIHGKGSFFPYRYLCGIRLKKDLPAGSTLTFFFKQYSLQYYEDLLFNFRIAIIKGDELIGYLGDACWQILGGPLHYFRVVAPTIVQQDETFSCRLLPCDQYRNRSIEAVATDDIVAQCEGLTLGKISIDEATSIITIADIKPQKEGVFYIKISLQSNPAIQGESNPVVIKKQVDQRIFWGDIHQHGYLLDGRGTPRESYYYAKNKSFLDFGAVAPHEKCIYSPPMVYMEAPALDVWPELKEAAREATDENFTALLGYEGQVRPYVGDMNVYHKSFDHPTVGMALGKEVESYDEYVKQLKDLPGEHLLLPHAHAGGGPAKFDIPDDPNLITNVEVCSVHGNFQDFYDAWLKAGRKVGVHGAGDNHMPAMGNANPGAHYVNTNGLTASIAAANNYDEIWRSYKERRTYAVTGNRRIYMDFTMNGQPMGSVIPKPEKKAQIKLQVAGTSPILKIELHKNGEVLRTWRPYLKHKRAIRIVWWDTWNERRADDSLTIGSIYLDNGSLKFLDGFNAWTSFDTYESEQDDVVFQTAAYSEVPRGVLLELFDTDQDTNLYFTIDDRRWDREMLKDNIEMPLALKFEKLEVPLQVDKRDLRPEFSKEIVIPHFHVEAEWVDPEWSRVVDVKWEDDGQPGDYYYIKVEQLDANFAWSSPIWIE